MPYQIRKKFSFSAAHVLQGLPSSHPCSRLHGHNYEVEVVLFSIYLNKVGFVRDYRELTLFKNWLDENFDHKNINDVVNFPTTAENLACHFFQYCHGLWPEVKMVRVSETPKTWAEYTA